MTDIARHLETMLDVLDEKEWIKGDLFEGPHGLRGDHNDIFSPENITGVCLAGSYSYAVLTGMLSANDWYLVAPVILAAVEDLFPDRAGWSVPAFNDCKDTTVEDARLVLKTAIEKVREAA